jgi:hypothetical protein
MKKNPVLLLRTGELPKNFALPLPYSCRLPEISSSQQRAAARLVSRPDDDAGDPPGSRIGSTRGSRIGSTRGSGSAPPGEPDRLHPVSNSFVDEFDGQKWNSARWPNGILTSGLPTSRPAQRQSPKAQTADPADEGTNRLSAGEPDRLHPGSRIGSTRCRIRSLTNSTCRNGIRLVGRMHSMRQVCQRADRHNANRRRHKPPTRRTKAQTGSQPGSRIGSTRGAGSAPPGVEFVR